MPTTGTITSACLNDWTSVAGATGHPNVISSGTIETFINVSDNSAGYAYASMGPPSDSVPAGATVELTSVAVQAHGNGGHVSPSLQFNDAATPLHSGDWFAVGSGSMGESLNGTTASTLITYVQPYWPDTVFPPGDAASFMAAAAGAGIVVGVSTQRSLTGLTANGDWILYEASPAITLTWTWTLAATIDPPGRGYPRDDTFGIPGRGWPPPKSIQASGHSAGAFYV